MYLQAAALRASIYFDCVPSKANIADLPSRYAWRELRSELRGLRGATSPTDVLRVPSVSSWSAPLSVLLSHWRPLPRAHAVVTPPYVVGHETTGTAALPANQMESGPALV